MKIVCLIIGFILATVVVSDPNINFNWGNNAGNIGYDKVVLPIKVLVAPTIGRTYYYALQCNFLGDDRSAIYMGIQPREPGKNLVIFSTFGTGTDSEHSQCVRGADGGSGTSCSVQYNWNLNELYYVSMQRVYMNVTHQSWEGYIVTEQGQSVLVGRFSVPSTRRGLQAGSYFFDEYFPFNGASKDPTKRKCIEYTKLSITAPLASFNNQWYPSTPTKIRVDTGKDSCAVYWNQNNARATETFLNGIYSYDLENGFLPPIPK
ncbi:hypothetical protein CYY_010072 [Polysphondylium violaceum]|uniref:Carbohydrate binding domain-containing protein n=1 Tax=Polysphondylium violaceum TaxID=133409 RepID=A0A8J4PK36_9MYCE|nr:hypothetical protein CYY_010072 [Polysphondylium violaceum]